MAPVASAAEMMTAETAVSKVMATAAVTEMVASVMAASVMSSVSRFGDDGHGQCRDQRHYE